MIAAVVHAFATRSMIRAFHCSGWCWSFALGILMSSTVRYYSFKDIQWTKRHPSLAIVLVVLLIGGVVFLFSRPTLLVIASVYTLHGVTLQLVRFVRHRLASRTA